MRSRRASRGSARGYDRNEDHLAQCIELLGRFPKRLALTGEHARTFFNRRGELKHIDNLKSWPLESVLREKYKLPQAEAERAAGMLTKCLELNPAKRATALDCL